MRSNRPPLGDITCTYAINLDKLSSESQCVSFPNQMEPMGFQSSNLPASASATGAALSASKKARWALVDVSQTRRLLIWREWASERAFMRLFGLASTWCYSA
jgi:hypothetical protein